MRHHAGTAWLTDGCTVVTAISGLIKAAIAIPVSAVVTDPGIVPVSTHRTYVEDPQTQHMVHAEVVLFMEERMGAVRSKWIGVATDSVVTAIVMVLGNVPQREPKVCAEF